MRTRHPKRRAPELTYVNEDAKSEDNAVIGKKDNKGVV